MTLFLPNIDDICFPNNIKNRKHYYIRKRNENTHLIITKEINKDVNRLGILNVISFHRFEKSYIIRSFDFEYEEIKDNFEILLIMKKLDIPDEVIERFINENTMDIDKC